MKSIRKIKTKLLMVILGVAFGFSIIIFAVTLSQLMVQKESIEEKGYKEAQVLSEDTKQTLGEFNKQAARDFASASNKYFNQVFTNIRKHVVAVADETAALYQAGNANVPFDDNVGLIGNTKQTKIADEFGAIAPVRSFIENLPSYNAKKLDVLDLYVVTQSGMCLDGTNSPLGKNYQDLRREEWYQQARKHAAKYAKKHTGKKKKDTYIYWSGVFTGKVTGKEKVICVVPVYGRNGSFKGCAAGDMEAENFRNILQDFDEEQINSVIFFDRNGKLMHATKDYEDENKENNEKIKEIEKHLGKNEIVNAGDEIYAFSKLKETGWTICLVLSQEVMNQTTQNIQASIEENARGITEIVEESIQKSIFLFVVIAAIGAAAVLIITNVLAAGFVRPIRRLMSQVGEVGSGNLEQVIAVDTKDEIGQLAGAFNRMLGELKNYMANLQVMTVDKERMTAELDVAKQIQRNMLPDMFPAFPERNEFDIYALLQPVNDGGENFYDFFLVDRSHFCMVLGDVSGSGVPATMFAVVTKTHIKNYAQLGYQPDRILVETNNQLSYKNDAGLTVSVFIGIIDLITGSMQYVNAGQMPPLWKHSGADFDFLRVKSCFALGNMENVPYWQQSVRLAQGDMIFLYTKGVAETQDEKGNEYTQEYLYEYLNGLVRHEYKLDGILEGIEEDLQRFSGGAVQKQDSTMLVFRYFGSHE